MEVQEEHPVLRNLVFTFTLDWSSPWVLNIGIALGIIMYLVICGYIYHKIYVAQGNSFIAAEASALGCLIWPIILPIWLGVWLASDKKKGT